MVCSISEHGIHLEVRGVPVLGIGLAGASLSLVQSLPSNLLVNLPPVCVRIAPSLTPKVELKAPLRLERSRHL